MNKELEIEYQINSATSQEFESRFFEALYSLINEIDIYEQENKNN